MPTHRSPRPWRHCSPRACLWIALVACTLGAPMLRADPDPAPRAAILIDARLHAALGTHVADYARAAAHHRGFPIAVLPVAGLDDEPHATLRARVRTLVAANPALEGVILAGNVKLPSFYSPRGDNFQTRYFPHALEDLDLVLERRLVPGTRHAHSTSPAELVPEHDVDAIVPGAETGPSIWTAHWPVGLADPNDNGYDAWARQLEPFLAKATRHHASRPPAARRMYMVSNQLWDLGPAWAHYGPERIDFCAMNPRARGDVPDGTPAEQYCALRPDQAYVRVALEDYPSYAAFEAAYRERAWMGEGWQSGPIFLRHMAAADYDLAWLNVHSCESHSLVSSAEARAITRGAWVMMLSGCGVGGYRAPGNPAFTDTSVAPTDNVMCAYVYGPSRSLAALGCPFNRGHESRYELMIARLVQGDYLGQAHFARMRAAHAACPGPADLAMAAQELLVGDPFVDLASR